jgi:signal transduction histidine kinase
MWDGGLEKSDVARWRLHTRALFDELRTINVLLQGFCAIMAAVLVVTFASRAVLAYQREADAREAHTEAGITRDLFTAMKALRIERGSVNAALNIAPSRLAKEQRAEISQLRAQSRAALDRATAKLQSGGFPQLSGLVGKLSELRSNFDYLRARVDNSLALEIARRPAKLGSEWIRANNALVDSIDDISEHLLVTGRHIDPRIEETMDVKRMAWLTSDAGGMDRLILAQAIAGSGTLPAVRREQIENGSGRIVASWKMVRNEMRLGRTPPDLSRAIDKAQKAYFTVICKKRIAIITALSRGAPSPYSVEEWLSLSRLGLASVVTVADTAVTLAESYSSSDESNARVRFFESLGGVLLFLGFGIFSILYAARRVAAPIRSITQQMSRVAEGKLDQTVPYQNRADEIGHLARALEVFRTNAIEKRRIEAQLIESKEAAEASSHAKSNFLANMSHELRTPLNAIIGFAELLETETFGPLGSPRYREYSGVIRDSGRHLLGLINDVLDLSRLDAGRTELVEESLGVDQLAETVLTMVEQQAATNGVTLAKDVTRGLPLLRADPKRVRQILLNLLSNAVKFTPSGGTVTLRASLNILGELSIVVADTGIGMAPQDIPKALERFGQVDSKLTRKFEGAGLGLPLAKQLMELHGGTLTLASTLNAGTVVTVTFPVDRLVRESVAREPATAAVS